jgi:CubicO group peptidase (beta-lactamase class C family)
MKRTGKTLLWITTGIIGLAVVGILISFLFYPPQYVFRVLLWQQSDVFDYQKFPEHVLETGPSTFFFASDSEEDRVRAVFNAILEGNDFDAFLAQTHTQAFIVIQDGTILYEKYFNGTERDSIVTSFSAAKSFASALIGIAIAEGHINSVDDPITDYIPELADRDPDFRNITIRHLLMMSSGIKYVEFPFLWGDDSKTYYYPDLRKLALEDTRIVTPPGEYFLYNNYNPLLLGLIIERSTGTSVADYMQEKIWKSLAMEFPGSWSVDSEVTGFEKMESGVNGRAIDFAKFGQLLLNNGNWGGTQVIPAEWVSESTQIDTSVDNNTYYGSEFGQKIYASGQGYYKYMWYGLERGNNDYDFFAYGKYGQFIYVSPSKDLIIVRNGEQYGIDPFGWIEMFYLFASTIESRP